MRTIILIAVLLCLASVIQGLMLTRRQLKQIEIEDTKPFGPIYDKNIAKYCKGSRVYYTIKNSSAIICRGRWRYYLIKYNGVRKIPVFFRPHSHMNGNKSSFSPPARKNWFETPRTCLDNRISYTEGCKGITTKSAAIVQKDCYFVHGVGQRGTNTLTTTFPEYWGAVEAGMTQCSRTLFLHLDTKSYGFDSPVTAKSFCKLLGAANGGLIKNKYIYTHSMGGLIATYAISRGYCFLDFQTSKVFMSEPPLKGSKGAEVVNSLCMNTYNYSIPGYNVSQTAYDMDYCDNTTNTAYPAYFSLFPSNPNFNGLSYWASQLASGLMCGDCYRTGGFIGSLGWVTCAIMDTQLIESPQTAVGLGFIQWFAGLSLPNDGMVEKPSCVPDTITEDQFWTNATGRYYMANINHQSGSGYDGDSATGMADAEPVIWFQNMYTAT